MASDTSFARALTSVSLRWELLRNFIYDWRRYARSSFVFGARTRKSRTAMICILAHSLEHGMALPEPRRGYGQEKTRSLLRKLKSYLTDFGPDTSSLWAIDVLRAYVRFHQKEGVDMDPIAAELVTLEELISGELHGGEGGVTLLTRDDLRAATDFDFTRFMLVRHSVRQYAPIPVDEDVIRDAVANAQRAPSVCNRQTCMAYAFTDKATIERVLKLQSGNAGFGHEVGVLFIITSDMQHFNLIGERNQGWVDGGIFAMALNLSLHAAGLGACFLNWSVTRETDQALRRLVGIPDSELVITMMSAGHLKDKFAVPVSRRKDLDDVLVLNPNLRGYDDGD